MDANPVGCQKVAGSRTPMPPSDHRKTGSQGAQHTGGCARRGAVVPLLPRTAGGQHPFYSRRILTVKNRLTGWLRWNMGLSAEDIAEVRVQGIEPDLFQGTGLAVVLLQFAAALSLADANPVGRLVGGADRKSVV